MNARPPSADGKKALRALMAEALSGFAPENLRREGNHAADAITDEPLWKEARTVFAFLSMGSEITSDGVVEASLRAGKTVTLPRVQGGELSFRGITSLNGPWAVGSFGIREPLSDAPVVDLATLPGPLLVIAPGVAFDSRGGRLGHGKGYYDRFLRSLRALRSDVSVVGLCASLQLVPQVPTDESDESMDAVCSGGSFFFVRS
jgi:5-formyltetrahydrofolate cyclo-ligase